MTSDRSSLRVVLALAAFVVVLVVALVLWSTRTPDQGTPVLVVGDSVTYQSISELRDRFDWTDNLTIQAYPGYRTDELLPKAEAAVAKYHPSIVVVLTGYNDLTQRVDTTDALESMMELTGRADCGVWLLLPTKAAYEPDQAVALNDEIETLAGDHGVAVAEGWRDSVDDTEGPDPSAQLVRGDEIHPTPAGSARIADVMADAVERECS